MKTTMEFAAVGLIVFACGSRAQPADAQTAFEVASIKPSDPAVRFVRSNGGPGTNDPGLFTCENCSLTALVSMAYEIPQYRITAPDWMQAAPFVVSAKVPPGATKEQFHSHDAEPAGGAFRAGRPSREKRNADV